MSCLSDWSLWQQQRIPLTLGLTLYWLTPESIRAWLGKSKGQFHHFLRSLLADETLKKLIQKRCENKDCITPSTKKYMYALIKFQPNFLFMLYCFWSKRYTYEEYMRNTLFVPFEILIWFRKRDILREFYQPQVILPTVWKNISCVMLNWCLVDNKLHAIKKNYSNYERYYYYMLWLWPQYYMSLTWTKFHIFCKFYQNHFIE